jgi:signal transduction histidine kinase
MLNRIKWLTFSLAALIVLWGNSFSAAEDNDQSTNSILIRTITVDGKAVRFRQNSSASLGSSPHAVLFHVEPNAGVKEAPIRIRYRLQGYDNEWHDRRGQMGLSIRFYDNSGDMISEQIFWVQDESVGWTRSFITSSLIHRRETLVVPPHTDKVMVVVTSAGPKDTVGVYAVADLTVSKTSSNGLPVVLIRSPFEQPRAAITKQGPEGWVRDGTHPSMARIVGIGQGHATDAFVIMDDDPIGHAEWHNDFLTAPQVSPGDPIVVEWNEMYSIGSGAAFDANYGKLASGRYKFQVEEVDLLGNPTGLKTSLTVVVPPPLWKLPWFWATVLAGAMTLIIVTNRYIAWHRMQREMARLRNQRVIEGERLRIARDIHDDLGARVTQISLVSAMAGDNPNVQPETRTEFEEISRMSRDLISALYETVWAVNPENDNLEALGNYICQMVTKMGENAGFQSRFSMERLSRDVEVPSQTRHSISMAVKEAVHNIIKHAAASLVTIQITYDLEVLTISIHDNGRGFQMGDQRGGSGLSNMQQRLKDTGGTCTINSRVGGGTEVVLRLNIRRQTDLSARR